MDLEQSRKVADEPRLPVLCQPGAGKSCAACCGLYNYADSSRESLTRRLRARTRRFGEMTKTGDGLERYAKEISAVEDLRKRYEVIYCCEYLGFLDEQERRVGCLLHPAQNSGIDRRVGSFYGQELCAGYLCPSHQYIPKHQLKILIKIIDDWYLYGLCLTDIDLVTTYFRLLSDKIGEELKPGVFNNQALKDIAREYFNWKISWPFRSPDINRLGKYYFDGSQYMISRIDYEIFDQVRSPFDPIFLSLSSCFSQADEIEQAENLIRTNIEKFSSCYPTIF
ncbi:MAG: hypothetical protein HY787_06345 [Deltaproteobacteria bacterium]|nr:hypothetical protein [Deltaproteobacteria bacterium]